ncbi:hypothetical protein [Floccifex sp.]|uniref:hypothetical protein n=1 Tax=Floccifex sp. TaxID=2815810 RepID=UPI002A75504B|nr:hypothetical protein [Floccifex sp.]MDD7280756.1 hypothetical protein [Erysipelotrichaceae bacterium]MDY2957617.1 hypothetical protein [Floccifex sp.]
MNKQEVKKKRIFLKNEEAIKYVKYIKVISIILILLICLYTGFLSALLKQPLTDVISKNMSVVCGFIIATASLFTYFVADQYIKDFNEYKNIEGNRFKLLAITFFSACFLNFVTMILGILALNKIYKWKGYFSFGKMMTKIKKEGQLGICVAVFVVFAILFILETTIGSLVLR